MIDIDVVTGWGRLTIDEFCERVSYLDDPAEQLLASALMAFDPERKIPITFNAEGYEYSLVIFPHQTVTADTEEGKFYVINKGICEYGQKLINDIRSHVEDFVMFPYESEYYTELEKQAKRSKYLAACDVIERKLRNDSNTN